MVGRVPNPSDLKAARRGPARRRMRLVTVFALLASGLAACGDPDDDGGGGGGYVAAPPIVQFTGAGGL
ncbi:hypothetical protein [Blastococcus capsensis]|uniref:hypothetical protein n=1 Tax=Blastococcus capsensis TaxID=1564163 RepID=UPI002540975C|nr:hypothetical protein [Blastococcus capsensis]MDK3256069.1 hypothetical protein [Blastococcus capsensis]